MQTHPFKLFRYVTFASFLFLTPCLTLAQQGIPSASFSKSKLKIGEPVRYHLSLRHAKEMELLFPDQRYNYSPFELVSKEFYPTQTSEAGSLDSAVYVLRTFSVEDSINYRLPVFTLNTEGDSTAIFPPTCKLEITQLTHGTKDTNHLKEIVAYVPLKIQKDYTNTFAIVAAILVITLLVFLFFRKRIIKRIKLYTIRQSHNTFNKNFEKLENDFIKTQRLPIMENALSLWKVYLTRLEGSPINTYTTTEIIALFHQEELATGLQIIDKSIYRGMISGEPEKAFTILKKFSNQRYQKIKREIINE